MTDIVFATFERIARSTSFNDAVTKEKIENKAMVTDHPFDSRNFHTKVINKCLRLFDNGHYPEAVFAAFKVVEIEVKAKSGVSKGQGFTLMMAVFDESKPKLRFNQLSDENETNEQIGFKHMFAGAFSGVRNPRGHGDIQDTIDHCLEHLSLASYLLRQLDKCNKP